MRQNKGIGDVRLCLGSWTLWIRDKSSRVEMSGNPFAVIRSPGGNDVWEWNFEEERVRKIA